MKKVYMIRRIVALFLILLILVFVTKGVKNVFRKETATVNAETNELEELITRESKNLNLKEESVFEVGKANKELLAYRQEVKKDQSMGRGTKQSLLNKEVYLTFDDGPSDVVTPKILDILKEEDVQATFFIVGNMTRKNPEILKRIHDEGHAIGIHSNTHNYKEIYANSEALSKDIDDCLESVKNIVGQDFETNIYRFPGGSFGRSDFKKTVEDKGYVYFDWNVLNGDAEGNNLSEDYLVRRFNETSKGYNIIISLMHDTNAKEVTAKTLPDIIKDLKSKGYVFKTLGEI